MITIKTTRDDDNSIERTESEQYIIKVAGDAESSPGAPLEIWRNREANVNVESGRDKKADKAIQGGVKIFDGPRTENGEYKTKTIVSDPSAKANEGK